MASSSSDVDLSNIPLSKPPPGEITDFANAESISWAGRLSIYLTLPIMVITFALRMYARFQKRQFGIDDLVEDVLGRHAGNIPVSAIQPWFFEFGIISILVSYLVLTASLLYYLLPHEGDGGWGSPANTRREGDPSRIIDFTQGIFSAVSDYYVLTIPIFVVAQLQSPLSRKIGVSCIFLTGLMVAELNVGILCACISVFFVLFKGIVQRTESGFQYLREHLNPHNNEKGQHANSTQTPQPKLAPLITSGTLTGLKSMFRKAGRTKNQGTEKALTDASGPEFLELQSIDYDYHAQLRQSSHAASTRSLIRAKSHV
ncbi:hypothetical protein F4825DRAFT_450196 [Nemania diffusa]|nr:hypothetical protein F4825DRAFT_450196 [Nemania diffusa]